MDHQVKLLCLEMFSANPAGLVQSPFMTHILPATLHRQVNTAALIQYLHTNTPWRWQRSTEITLSGCTGSNPSSWSKITAAHNSSSDQRMLQRVNTACRPCGSSRTAPHRTEDIPSDHLRGDCLAPVQTNGTQPCLGKGRDHSLTPMAHGRDVTTEHCYSTEQGSNYICQPHRSPQT